MSDETVELMVASLGGLTSAQQVDKTRRA